jgi:hypothetical protein
LRRPTIENLDASGEFSMVRPLQASHAMKRRPFAAPLAMALAASVVRASPARAEDHAVDKAAAQALFDQAKDLLARDNAAEACPKLEESQRLDPTSGTLINLADCYERQGRLATAWTAFLQAAATARAAGHLEREQVAKERAAGLALRLPKIVIQVPAEVAGLEIKRDGMLVGKPQWGVPIPADRGQHRVVASAPGRKGWDAVVTVASDAESVPVIVPMLEPIAHTPVPETSGGLGPHRVSALVAGGVGVAGLVMGTAFGLRSISKHNEAERHCDGAVCRDQEGVDLRAQAMRAGNLATVGFIVDAVGLVSGAALWLTAKSDSTTGARPAIGVGLGTIVVAHHF